MSKVNKIEQHKKALIEALGNTLGNVTQACEMVGCSRGTHYNYYKDDPSYRETVDELSNLSLDFIESKFYEKVQEGDTACIIFGLKTKGKKRGWTERDESNEKETYTPPNITISI